MAKKTSKSKTLPIYLVNGPNLNTLGTREPEIYGTTTLAQIEKMAAERAAGHGYGLVAKQSNKEGELVEFIQEARTQGAAVILNAGAYTHTSVAVLDALKMITGPIIEVHISNPLARESFRHHSYVALAATGAITGVGPFGYLLAVDAVAHLLKNGKKK
jgi:3-dehydroquinate dehydratase-2